jgi:hypothetical protein
MTETFVNHCIHMFNALDERAINKKLESGELARVFAGSYTDVWKSTKIPQTYYTPIRRSLEKHRAIQIIQKGTKNTDTVLVLFGLPDAWEVDGWRDSTDLTNSSRYATLSSDVQELKKSLGGINVIMALQELERRLVKLENSSSRLDQEVKSLTIELKLQNKEK